MAESLAEDIPFASMEGDRTMEPEGVDANYLNNDNDKVDISLAKYAGGGKDASRSRLDGLWRDKDHSHMIQEMLLTWSDSTITPLQANGDEDSVSMVFNEVTINGHLNGACSILQWSDGDRWTRIALDGIWDDLGHFHCVQGAQLQWSDGTESTLTLSGWGGVAIVFRGVHVQGTLERSGDRIVWSDGDVWLRAGVDGHWQESAKGGQPSKTSQIAGSTMLHSSEKHLPLIRDGRCSLSMSIDGRQLQAHMDDIGRQLLWSDGDVWTRIQAKPESSETVEANP